jgi:ABC-type iron transport system FetAB ATPase subunit
MNRVEWINKMKLKWVREAARACVLYAHTQEEAATDNWQAVYAPYQGITLSAKNK